MNISAWKRFRLLLLALFSVAISFFFLNLPSISTSPLRIQNPPLQRSSLNHSIPLKQAIQSYYKALILPITSPTIYTSNGGLFSLPKAPIWTKPNGQEICIIDVDTRPLSSLNTLKPGLINHYLYAQIHNYTYKHIQIQKPTSRSEPWAKLPIISTLLRQFNVVVCLDADAIFTNLEIPLEWLLNYWEISPDIAIAMSKDPAWGYRSFTSWWWYNYDSRHRLRLNPGFIIAQKSPTTVDMLNAWNECPEKISGCRKYARAYPAEMGAFAEYTRYEDVYAGAVKELPCEEANGFPGQGTECKGTFVQHYTTKKGWLNKRVEEILDPEIMEMLYKDMVRENGN